MVEFVLKIGLTLVTHRQAGECTLQSERHDALE